MCLHSCAPCFFSGPHVGVISDNTLIRKYPPPLAKGEYILGDKAYTDRSLSHYVLAPIKKQKHSSLSPEQHYFNDMLSWYRSSIEHTFGYMKRFNILSNIFIIILFVFIYFLYLMCMYVYHSSYNISW